MMQVNDKVKITKAHPSGLFKAGWEGVIVFRHTKNRFDVELTEFGNLPEGNLVGKGFENQVLMDASEMEVTGSIAAPVYRRGSIISVSGKQYVVEQNAIDGCWVETDGQQARISDQQVGLVDDRQDIYEWALQQDYNSVYNLMKEYEAVHGATPGLYGIIIEARNYNKINKPNEE